MKLWTIEYDKNNKTNFPQIVYKGNRVITADEQAALTLKLFRVIKLTNRDKLGEITSVIDECYDSQELPFKALYNIVFGSNQLDLEFQTEYMVELLNTVQIELEELR